MKEKTVLTQFIEYILSGKITDALSQQDKFLELEKTQVICAYNQGYREAETDLDYHTDKDVSEFEDAERYFTDTYEQPK